MENHLGLRNARGLDEGAWNALLQNIEDKTCTPFIGAGACVGSGLPTGAELARQWAREYKFPLSDSDHLARVAQYLAVNFEPDFPRQRLGNILRSVKPPDFNDPCEPHRLLADLDLPIYVTTNYDDFMLLALKSRGKDAVRDVCRWNSWLRTGYKSILKEDRSYQPNSNRPLVYHLHGYKDILESLVLTEDDYLDFLIGSESTPEDPRYPPCIEGAFSGASILFLGYSLNDWNIRVLFRTMMNYVARNTKKSHVSVQLVPLGDNASDARRREAQDFLNRYFGEMDVRVYWGDCKEFAAELRRRLNLHRRRTRPGPQKARAARTTA
jgi:hypothetical protein